MSDMLPRWLNPWVMYRHHQVVSGVLALADMPNLLASQQKTTGDAWVTMQVVQRADGQTVLMGEANVELALQCQRCLGDIIEQFEVAFSRVLVKYEQQLTSVDEADDAMVCEESFDPLTLVEEEFILALPMIAKHDDCDMAYANNEVDEERQHPFANLKDLID